VLGKPGLTAMEHLSSYRGRVNLRAVSVVLALALVLTGCAPTSGSRSLTPTRSTAAERILKILKPLPGVVDVAAHSESMDDLTVDVTLTKTITDDQLVSVARTTRFLAVRLTHNGGGVAVLRIPGDPPPADSDLGSESPDALAFAVFPHVWQSAEATARTMNAIRAIPGVVGVEFLRTHPTVTVTDAAALGRAVGALRTMPLWKVGGTVWADGGRVRFADTKGQVPDTIVAAIVAQATAHPEAQFWLQAPLDGPTGPQLYVDHTDDQGLADILAAFEALKLTKAERALKVPFFITADPSKPSVTGFFGVTSP
jgi:hypothetical protein